MDSSLVFLLCLFIGSLEASDCPPEEDMWPCKCSSDVKLVECRSIRKAEELIPPMEALRRSKTRVDTLKIENSSLSHIPVNLFKDTHIEEVEFFNTKIISLTEYGFAFNGLEKILRRIEADDVDFVSDLHFDQFRNLERLKTIDFFRCRMHSTVHSLPYLPELSELFIKNSGISHISDKAFDELPNLAHFSMEDNEITEMKRRMFPNPAKRLSWMDLSGNMLDSLPKDFFENMPNLEHIELTNNKFVTISEKPFFDVLSNGKLWIFDMAGNPLHCDCKMSWIGGVRFPKNFRAKCVTPEALSGKTVNSLDFESLRLHICNSGVSPIGTGI